MPKPLRSPSRFSSLHEELWRETVEIMEAMNRSDQSARMRCTFAKTVRKLQGLPEPELSRMVIWRPQPYVRIGEQ
jgi:hypothetical protein